MRNNKTYYIYVLRCIDNSLYTGITTDVNRRFKEHSVDKKLGAKYTRARKPISIEAVWCCETRSDALKLESAFKKLQKLQKEQIIRDVETFEKLLSEKLDIGIYVYLAEFKNYILQ